MRYFLNRLGFLILSLWAAVTLNFILPRLMPGNPAQAMIAKQAGNINPSALKAIEQELGLSNGPLYQQYFQYLGNLLTGHWGSSFQYFPTTVVSIISNSLPWTIILLGIVTIIAVVVGTLVGILIAWRRGGTADNVIPIVTMFGQAIPSFWLGLICIYFFGFIHHWFPMAHGSGDDVTQGYNLPFITSAIYHSILPAFVVFVGSISGWIIGMRNNMMTTLGEDYVVFAEAKGVPTRRLIFSYAARNALLPQLTSIAIALSSIIGGQILIEQVFSYPGIGYGLTNAVSSEDYPLIQGMFLIIALTALVINFIVDMLYGRLDPRVRRRGATS
ncbi:peptide/nickel transport system permease protein [Alicyclobacillus sacchari]|uniref:Peptide/nickel transport system permease protein n=1 Tax=Alicyclobacillus sacchari TaxID=392010 RepID=A0A4R8LPX9_9BACL|nr:ABC transporter permease [Alicyclobacillus sacchari]TDY47900.1 peptide/nickel transport system permease protein [Alicyclobacillus sacchari]